MEETSNSVRPTYEQLENLVYQLQQRLMSTETALKNIDFASMRLNWLFKVLKYSHEFDYEFVSKCTKEIQNILTIEESTDKVEEDKSNGED